MATLPDTRQEFPNVSSERQPATDRGLVEAFRSFTLAADSLQIYYGQLNLEVSRLRCELEQKNHDLARSLADAERIRLYLFRLLERLPCGVLVLDSHSRPHFANPEAQRLLGLTAGSTDRPDAFAAPLRELLQELISDPSRGDRVWEISDGTSVRYVVARCASSPDRSSSTNDTIVILRDQTEEIRREQEQAKSQRLQLLGEMSMVLAHEIRNPLGSLELFTGLLADATKEQDQLHQWVEHLQAGLRALSATVNNVLHFHAEVPTPRLLVDLSRLLEDTVEFLRPLALQRGLGLDLVGLNGETLVYADPHRLQQVFFNLAQNAFRASAPGSLVRLQVRKTTQADRDRVEIDFIDQGAGIAPENLSKIFEPGFSTNPGSPGLGLAVCRKVAAQHDGEIRVRSTPDHGATFTLTLPLARNSA